MNESCSLSRKLCPDCGYKSKKVEGKKLCRACKIAESFEDYDEDKDNGPIDTSHNIRRVIKDEGDNRMNNEST